MSEAWTPPGNAAVAIFSAVQIIVLNIYYSKLAIDLNNQENHRFVFLCALYVHDALSSMTLPFHLLAPSTHIYKTHRTDTDYDDALIAKLYVFYFVNSYAALYYIAFVKVRTFSFCLKRAVCVFREVVLFHVSTLLCFYLNRPTWT